jgi:transcription elongation GreA/GreB family factor
VQIEDESGERMEVVSSSAGGVGAASPESPIGSALYGAAKGDLVTIEAPNASWQARVVKIS